MMTRAAVPGRPQAAAPESRITATVSAQAALRTVHLQLCSQGLPARLFDHALIGADYTSGSRSDHLPEIIFSGINAIVITPLKEGNTHPSAARPTDR